jgi:diguanylate cyclase (GGDEF)-like protein/excisionase family DNA binding protein
VDFGPIVKKCEQARLCAVDLVTARGVMKAVLPRPADATLSVAKAARVLSVHPNTVRAWSDAGRLRYYRINPRGDRRYRLPDLQRFLVLARVDGPSEPVSPPEGRDTRQVQRPRPQPDRVARGDSRFLADLADLAVAAVAPDADLQELLDRAARLILDAGAFRLVLIQQRSGAGLETRSTATSTPSRSMGRERTRSGTTAQAGQGAVPATRHRLRAEIPGKHGPWGVLLVEDSDRRRATRAGNAMGHADLETAARVIGSIVRTAAGAKDAALQLRRSEALREITADLGSRLRREDVLSALVDHAADLFGGDGAGAVLLDSNEEGMLEAARNLSDADLALLRVMAPGSIEAAAAAARRPVAGKTRSRHPHRAAGAGATEEALGTACIAPLVEGSELLGLLEIRHDSPYTWGAEELAAMTALAEQASAAIRTAQNHERMVTWAAQLQSIQQLGVRLNGLRTVSEIGHGIATELRELIDYHNVRVYRLFGTELIPVAMQGHIGEYDDETPEQIRATLGEGITGWVAEHRQPERLGDAAKDPRARIIPGTAADLDESLLLAPMIFEDRVLGVLVLAKLGLHQFRDDHLRLLVIYASLAAQAMANADVTERLREQSAALERQLQSQRELLGITESILAILDPSALLEQIADRLAFLVGYDTITIEVLDPASGLLVPVTARGVRAHQRMERWHPGETGLARWVVENNTPVLLSGAGNDPRISHVRDEGAIEGSSIAVPLRGRGGSTGVLTVERLGPRDAYTTDEFELVQLFAAQVSIALQNAEIHRAVEIRARTDALTGLLNHGTFVERLSRAVDQGDPFSLLMLDLDDFKRVNDELGHQAGDQLLAEIARALIGAIREGDHVFRYGGDEFTILLAGSDEPGAAVAAERARTALLDVARPTTPWHAAGIEVSTSIGIASFPGDGPDATSILLAADRACFAAKRSGRGRIASAPEGLALVGELSLHAPTPVDPPTVPVG